MYLLSINVSTRNRLPISYIPPLWWEQHTHWQRVNRYMHDIFGRHVSYGISSALCVWFQFCGNECMSIISSHCLCRRPPMPLYAHRIFLPQPQPGEMFATQVEASFLRPFEIPADSFLVTMAWHVSSSWVLSHSFFPRKISSSVFGVSAVCSCTSPVCITQDSGVALLKSLSGWIEMQPDAYITNAEWVALYSSDKQDTCLVVSI